MDGYSYVYGDWLMGHKYRIEHFGLKDGTIIDFDNMEEAGLYARLTKKALKVGGYPLRKVDIKHMYIPDTQDDEEENSD